MISPLSILGTLFIVVASVAILSVFIVASVVSIFVTSSSLLLHTTNKLATNLYYQLLLDGILVPSPYFAGFDFLVSAQAADAIIIPVDLRSKVNTSVNVHYINEMLLVRLLGDYTATICNIFINSLKKLYP